MTTLAFGFYIDPMGGFVLGVVVTLIIMGLFANARRSKPK